MNEKSVFRFNRYIVKEVRYLGNEEFSHGKEVKINLDFDYTTNVNLEHGTMEVELSVSIFDKLDLKDCPFKMFVCIKGYFELKAEKESLEKFKVNAIAILFPYIRATVSTYTANANITPVILPAININQYFRRKEAQKRESYE